MIEYRPIAIYLPQFHPIPENDEVWGKGFTEWTNVKKAKPEYIGHYQPHIPHDDIGYYDLNNIEVMQKQSDIAKKYGIYGFMFYHYWFTGRALLDMPLKNYRDKLSDAIPYFFCWANENWSRNWDGGDKKVFLEQRYSDEDNVNHINYLMPFFSDKKYIKIDNKPVIAIYKTKLIPNLSNLIETWQNSCVQAGYNGIYLINVEYGFDYSNPESIGFDANMEFHPKVSSKYKEPLNIFQKIYRKLWYWSILKKKPLKSKHWVINYKYYVNQFLGLMDYSKYKRYPCIMPAWDNTARRQNDIATIFRNSKPKYFKQWLNAVIRKFKPVNNSENFVIINAWNEWAEGNHIEPCKKYGYTYLEIIKACFN
jgi:lipopolysaccharide biosynthesis protein